MWSPDVRNQGDPHGMFGVHPFVRNADSGNEHRGRALRKGARQ